MKLQVCMHVGARAQFVRARWLTDPWFQHTICLWLSDWMPRLEPVETTPRSSRAVGVCWVAWGANVHLGVIPVSDGTELVLEVHDRWTHALREKLSGRLGRRMAAFLRIAADRLEKMAAEPVRP